MRGVAFQAFFSLALLVSAWALFDLAIYVGLRAFYRRFRACSHVFGSLCLVLLSIGWVALILWAATAFGYPTSSSQESKLTFYVYFFGGGMALLATPGLGGLLMRHAMRKEVTWWHGVLFFTFYLVVSHLGEFLGHAMLYDSIDPVLRPIDGSLSSFGFGPLGSFIGICEWLLVWSFTTIAPLLEIAMHPFWRAYQQHRSGTYQ
jgi:hypothetical protein